MEALVTRIRLASILLLIWSGAMYLGVTDNKYQDILTIANEVVTTAKHLHVKLDSLHQLTSLEYINEFLPDPSPPSDSLFQRYQMTPINPIATRALDALRDEIDAFNTYRSGLNKLNRILLRLSRTEASHIELSQLDELHDESNRYGDTVRKTVIAIQLTNQIKERWQGLQWHDGRELPTLLNKILLTQNDSNLQMVLTIRTNLWAFNNGLELRTDFLELPGLGENLDVLQDFNSIYDKIDQLIVFFEQSNSDGKILSLESVVNIPQSGLALGSFAAFVLYFFALIVIWLYTTSFFEAIYSNGIGASRQELLAGWIGFHKPPIGPLICLLWLFVLPWVVVVTKVSFFRIEPWKINFGFLALLIASGLCFRAYWKVYAARINSEMESHTSASATRRWVVASSKRASRRRRWVTKRR